MQVGRELCLSALPRFFDQHLAVADDGVERRAQLVAHVGQECALGFVGGNRFPFGALQFTDVVINGNAAHAFARDVYRDAEEFNVHK